MLRRKSSDLSNLSDGDDRRERRPFQDRQKNFGENRGSWNYSSRFPNDSWESITDQPPNPSPASFVFSDSERGDENDDDDDDDDEWIRDPRFDVLDRVVIM